MKRLLIYRLGSLGDTIIAVPFFRRIAELYPEHERIVLTNIPISSKAAPLLTVLGTSLVHRAISYPVGTRSPAALWDLRRRLLELETDTMIYLMPSRGLAGVYRDVAYFRLCGFRNLHGVPWTRDLDTCRVVQGSGEEEPECERLARALSCLGPIDLHDQANWDLSLDAAEIAAGSQAVAGLGGAPVIAINMGGKAAQKDWGIDNWRRLLTAIGRSRPDHGLLVVGAREDAERVQTVRDAWPGPVSNQCGTLSPRESAAAIKGSRVFIGHDSGPLHLASAVRVPCVGLFGDFNRPRKWHPYVGDNRTLHDMRGVRAIAVEQVVSAVAELLG
ncbi:glycosyltransferase family 9 protein [Xanthobacter sp. YC-JY1]|uniref:glycosyltransferase family 9 protein n=1 Tax=Xanthobacter sp. YC-JY1 TaxID=2419844 RepID=UPI001F2ED103|nr:glycosyltransferase family 9 protein [Xanthobacter sp. YC-JY1]UJX45581.1 lipopolysaccharide heptosyltransferase family protein [Xanthobacter sp. YC-JY1]